MTPNKAFTCQPTRAKLSSQSSFAAYTKGQTSSNRTVLPGRRERVFRIYAQQKFSTQLIGGGLGANQVFVAGAESQLGARLVQRLLQGGFKVTAGVPDEERAAAIVNFATSVELLKKQEAQKLRLVEVDFADDDSLQSALPSRGARIVAVVGEGAGSKSSKLDARAVTRILLAAQEVDAAQFILVTPSGSASGGGGFGGFFGGGGSAGGTGKKPSKVEQDIASSGLEFVIIRTGKTDIQDPEFETSNQIALGAQGAMPQQAKISKNQVASVVQQVIRLADSDVLVEAWASADAPAVDIEEAVMQVLPEAKIEDEEEEEEPGLASAAQEAAEEEAPKSPGGLFGSFGTRRIKAGAASPPEQPAPPPSSGTRRIKNRAQGKQAPEEGSSPAPKRQPFSFGKKASEKEEEEEEEDAAYNPQAALRGIFGRKVGCHQSNSKLLPPPKSSEKNQEADVGPEKARKSAVRGIKAAGNNVKKAAPRAGKAGQSRPGADEERPKKGFLASIGLGGETSFVDDDN